MPLGRLPQAISTQGLPHGRLPQAMSTQGMLHGRLPQAMSTQGMPHGRLPLPVSKKPEYAAWTLATFHLTDASSGRTRFSTEFDI